MEFEPLYESHIAKPVSRTLKIVGLLLPFVFLLSSCKSDDNENPCGILGGVINLNNYAFWIDQDYGQLTVEVKDDKGKIITGTSVYSNKISVYYPNATNNPRSSKELFDEVDNARFRLSPAQSYTYRAYNGERSFSGKIALTCEQGIYQAIKIGQ